MQCACLDWSQKRALEVPHILLNKFREREDANFISVTAALRQLAAKAKNIQTAEHDEATMKIPKDLNVYSTGTSSAFASPTQFLKEFAGSSDEKIQDAACIQNGPSYNENLFLVLLDSLTFDRMHSRSVADATPQTCDWILQHDSFKRWSSLDRGLHDGNELDRYLDSNEDESGDDSSSEDDNEDRIEDENCSKFLWIKGKPGSGKSVLMKYILQWAQQNWSKRNVLM
jgi:hypothetical protein